MPTAKVQTKPKAQASTTMTAAAPKTSVSLMTRLRVRLSLSERLLLTKYLAVLLNSGLPIDDALDILLQQSTGSLKIILGTLKNTVRSGNTLASGLSAYPHIFSSVYVNLVNAGEASGTLQKNFEELANQLQKEHELKKKIQGAMMYPSIVLMSAISVTTGIVVFVLPNITALFESLDVPLPWTTIVLIKVASLVEHQGGLILLGAIALVVGFIFLRRMPFVMPVTHGILLKFPVIGKIARDTNLATLTRLLGTLLQSGMPISEALVITGNVMRNFYFRRMFITMQTELAQGRTLTDALANSTSLIPPIALRLIRVGEETGTLGDMLRYLAEFYEHEVDEATRNAATLLEPLMIVMIGVMVALLAFSIISPIYQVVGSV
ncbi:MAG: Type IV pilin [Candidatus Uhrbacteria bacterium GW2011_GWD2_52_7]|uniref:Type IV pilin n=1 Tax=Candidatus Uhrbacteria bacterium GW2011_GWD2_52_7 TaxID=1618989 RepID=A0A0G1XHV1_9BACT|nr:MAG: Type IV pilin [Candidatus Uhrbacteria bacterium GW2011_GWD2_52_7]